MEEQRKRSSLATEAGPRDIHNNHTSGGATRPGPNGLLIEIPPVEDVNSSSNPFPSPLPTPSAVPQNIASTLSPNLNNPLPTIHSDEDYSSDVSSNRSRPDRDPNDASESSSFSDSVPPLEPTAGDSVKRNVNGNDDAAQGQPMKASKSHENVRRLSAAEIQQLTASPHSLPIAVVPDGHATDHRRAGRLSPSELQAIRQSILGDVAANLSDDLHDDDRRPKSATTRMPANARTLSTPPTSRNRGGSMQSSPRRNSFHPVGGSHLNLHSLPTTPLTNPNPLPFRRPERRDSAATNTSCIAPIPIPPVSLPTHLQLELAAQKPSPLYIQRPEAIDVPYESSAVKIERLINVILLPPFLERTLTIGALACLDSWLYTFTILPMRFLIAVGILAQWWGHVFAKEAKWITGYVWYGLGRLWNRGLFKSKTVPIVDVTLPSPDEAPLAGSKKMGDPIEPWPLEGIPTPRIPANASDSVTPTTRPDSKSETGYLNRIPHSRPRSTSTVYRHRRTKSRPSNLSAYNKADLLQGALIICSSIALMKLDGSRMYHFIRAQSDIKLYVIFNLLEVGDRLLGSLGQDILECLFSAETLARNAFGRSKVLMPLGMFILALVYNVAHAVALYFQCITLNVAVNSYSNALLTLLMSNQFVEVKSTVFKRFERDNLFQLTCADIVERFQLWIMLLVIGMRNVVEVGGLSVPGAGSGDLEPSNTQPLHSPTILPHSFTILPTWILSGEVLSPFLIVIGSEILVDIIKHAYVTKFNNIKRTFYSRILDILCKDYYTNVSLSNPFDYFASRVDPNYSSKAFTTPSLTRRLGLPVLPLSCLFIRASFQTYHMFLSTRLSPPIPPSTHTSLTENSAIPTSPAIVAALERFDTLIRDSLGRSVYGDPFSPGGRRKRQWWEWTKDDVIAAVTMVVFFFIVFLVLLTVKLLLGMVLLHYSRKRYARMKQREQQIAQGKMERESHLAQGKRSGGYGSVEIGEERSRWLNVDEKEGLKRKGKKEKVQEDDLERVSRYEMVAKRIW
ncbi:hypothetical protein jhhlp_003075 [Lomentospora prolificans]|uniref:Uncharacterized protein n=1 Tax=Lomentospora prolificans TaxID=41688 RepID=A0A2N3NFV2_9PEZI|nr:hypothetical protein jhhlp_003075 [Lomentospora prolificans]